MTPPESQSFQDVLVHYTSDKGLEGILRSNTLWATHADYTNDGEELKVLQNIILKFYDTKFWEDPDFRKELDFQYDQPDSWKSKIDNISCKTETIQKNIDAYIFSFSQTKETEVYHQNNGRLSQWRAYGNYGIVFPLQKIKAIPNSIQYPGNIGGGFAFGKIMYIDPKEPITKDSVTYTSLQEYIIKFIKQEDASGDSDKFHNDFVSKKIFLVLTTLLKNKGFEEENECRLVFVHLKKDYLEDFHNTNTNGEKSRTFEDVNQFIEKHKNFTIRRDRIVPYIDFFKHDPLPIEKILIGPAPAGEQAERKKMVEALLRHLNKEYIPVACSAIPYRG